MKQQSLFPVFESGKKICEIKKNRQNPGKKYPTIIWVRTRPLNLFETVDLIYGLNFML